MSRTNKLLQGLCVLVLWMGTLLNSASASQRHALVIGNSNYGSGFSLANPQNDAIAIANKLKSIGYNVHKDRAVLDLSQDEFNNEIDAFLSSINNGASTFIYYAGHGAASSGSNYLIPILPDGVRLRTESDIRNRSVSLDGILERVHARNPTGVSVVFLDACRDAPMNSYSRSINLTGLSVLDSRSQPQGTFIGFSTEYGKIAVDGGNARHSPFARAVLNNLDSHARAPIELFYKNISDEVYRSTAGRQFPIQEPKILGDYCLVPCEMVRETQPAQNPEYGYLSVITKPADASVCYLVEGEWDDWNCGRDMALPIGKKIDIRITADKFKTYTGNAILTQGNEQMRVELAPETRSGYKIAGAVLAAVVVGALISGRDSSSSSDDYQITINPPTQ